MWCGCDVKSKRAGAIEYIKPKNLPKFAKILGITAIFVYIAYP
jgi:hypothetical protein